MSDAEYLIKGSSGDTYTPAGGRVTYNRVNPSVAIVTTWQGILEVVLRGVTLFFVFLVFISACVAVGEINDLDGETKDYIDHSDDHHDEIDEVPDTPKLVNASRGAAGFLIFLSIVVTVYEILAIVLRFMNLTLVKTCIKVFLIVDIILSGVFAFVFLITGAVSGAYSAAWDDWVDFGKDLQDGNFSGYPYVPIFSDNLEDIVDAGENIRGGLGAAAAFCIFEVLAFLGLAGWVCISMVTKWALPRQAQY